jgi:hypothetical protein
MIATDSVMTTSDRGDVEPNKQLGGWSVDFHPRGVFIIQPGLYYGSAGKRAKTRGVPLSAITEQEQEFRDAFDAMATSGRLERGDVVVPQSMFCGIRYTLHRRNHKLLGQWITFDESGRGGKVIRFDWGSKRAAFPVLNPMPGVRSHIVTLPKPGSIESVTIPYSRNIGGVSREFELAFEATPDYVPLIESLN